MNISFDKKYEILNIVNSELGITNPNSEHMGFPLYVVLTGSHLHGTNSETSDTDVHVLYLPLPEDLLYGDALHQFKYTTGKDSEKNDKKDMDINFWSMQFFIGKLKEGDMNAIELLFSHTNTDAILYQGKSDIFESMLTEVYDHLFDPNKLDGMLHYVASHGSRYVSRGTKANVLKCVLTYCEIHESSERLSQHFSDIIAYVKEHVEGAEPFISCAKDNFAEYLSLCGAMHQTTIKLSELRERVNQKLKIYGERSMKAALTMGNDWKALAHAERVIQEIFELYQTGKLLFPLSTAEYLKSIKSGKVSPEEIEESLYAGIKAVDKISQKSKISNYDERFVRWLLSELYTEVFELTPVNNMYIKIQELQERFLVLKADVLKVRYSEDKTEEQQNLIREELFDAYAKEFKYTLEDLSEDSQNIKCCNPLLKTFMRSIDVSVYEIYNPNTVLTEQYIYVLGYFTPSHNQSEYVLVYKRLPGLDINSNLQIRYYINAYSLNWTQYKKRYNQ